ncbi:hypothetical protein [Kordiimonas aquimaris]|uniref:hypothetical protein n=1 Tax=Kordiimonas aquimaris TaxID=707591 RepID=UPI0021D10212|nr:hypothetical protein [Kordiimonas aquimaris]
MSKQHTPMTEADYDACAAVHGVDIALWPAADRARALVFLNTPKGQNIAAFDRMLTALRPDEGESEMILQTDATNFLARLQAIPDQYPQDLSPVRVEAQTFLQKIESFIDDAFDPARLWSPAGLATQGLAVALLMGIGVLVGAGQGPDTFNDYDISAGLFEVSSTEFSIDG